MDYRKSDGTTLREHYTALKRWDWIEAKTSEIPPGGEYLWSWFWDIIGGKGSEEGFWSCLRAWSDMTGVRPTMWEVESLQRLHGEYQAVMGKKMGEK